MCGITGYIGQSQSPDVLSAMMDCIEHRGPDGSGVHNEHNVHIGMRRLSIIDLAGGHQPIYNHDKTIGIVFNGEIYNYQDIRKDLQEKGSHFQTQSDTEVIIHLYEIYGEDCVRYLDGMFVFCVHDLRQNSIFIARDRLGIKPLYYSQTPSGSLVFGSEIKSILQHPEISAQPDLNGIDAFMTLRYSPGPDSMFQNIKKLPEGCYLTFKDQTIDIQEYWNWENARNTHNCITDADYQDTFDTLFENSVKQRMISDVPLGAFLSGGVDSTAIVTAMSAHSTTPVRTFTVGFGWKGDELEDAQHVAQRLGCDHHEVICTQDNLSLLPKLIWALDEPVGDPIILPMFLLSQLAREHVKIALSGEGADELQAGYFMHKTLLRAHTIPKPLYNLSAPFMNLVPPALLNMGFDYPGKMGARGKKKLIDFMSIMGQGDLHEQYHFLISLFDKRDKEPLYTKDFKHHIDTYRSSHTPDLSQWKTLMAKILRLQKSHWLPDDILAKLDKMTMVNSLEGRVPFMDHHLVSFLLSVPDHLKNHQGQNKILLRNYIEKRLPGISKRPKKAFYMPLGDYLNTSPLKDMMEECLSESSIKKRGLFHIEAIRRIKDLVSSGDFVYEKQLFSLLTLELWFRIYIDKEKGWI